MKKMTGVTITHWIDIEAKEISYDILTTFGTAL